jgi:hypothetical protein
VIAAFLQVAGLAVFAAGCWVLAPWLGLMALGFFAAGVGVVLELERRRNARKPD